VRVYTSLEPAGACTYRALAFPRHVPLLDDLGASGATVAIGASVLGSPVGLAIAGLVGGELATLHSIVVAPAARRRGVGTGLLAALEALLRDRGVGCLVGAYRIDRPGHDAVTRLLARRDFERRREAIEYVFPVARLDQAPVLDVACHGATVVEYAPDLLAPLADLPEPSGFGPGTLAPADHDADLATLVAIDGRVVACAMGRRDGADTAYVSLLYVHPDFRRRRALAAFALKRFLANLTARDIGRLTCEVDVENVPSRRFVDGRLARYADHRALVHVVRKRFAGDE
jgi:ribosomal protein S18 acetylase RimI-like enzyme